MPAGVGHAETQGHHVEEAGLRQRQSERREIGAEAEVEFIDAGLERVQAWLEKRSLKA